MFFLFSSLAGCENNNISQKNAIAQSKFTSEAQGAEGSDLGVQKLHHLNSQGMLDISKYYPLSNYKLFPKSTRRLLQREEFENSICRQTGAIDGPSQARVWRHCNARYYVLVALEDKGWCWGGSTTEASKHWIKCADDPDSGTDASDEFSRQELSDAEHEIYP